MNGLLETVLKSGDGAAVQQLARSFGVSGDDALQAALGTAAAPSAAGQAGSGGIAAMLGDMLDADNDGSVVDDLLGMARRLF